MYPIVPKSRRYKTYLCSVFMPINWNLILEFLLCKNFVNMYPYLKYLNLFYHNSSIWYFNSINIFWKKASLTNNLNLSYDYWLLKNQLSLLSFISFTQKQHSIENLTRYTKTIKIFNFNFKNKKLSLMFILIFISVFKLDWNYVNTNQLSTSHLVISNWFNFFVFNNYYYFKTYNY